MCLKTNLVTDNRQLKQEILQKCDELNKILKEGKEQEELEQYELVRQQGKYNMLDPRARQLTGLSKEKYQNIQQHYSELMLKYPNTREKVRRRLEYITSANIAKIIALRGCPNCIETVSKKLDVKQDDLCEKCKKILHSISP